MQCLQCQHENREGRRFCAECGSPLPQPCAACSFVNEPDEKFCGGCGASLADTTPSPKSSTAEPSSPSVTTQERAPASYTPQHLAEKILTSRSALEGERKQVTVLFCDLANSTAIAEHIGPEAMHTLLNRFFELALEEVHRYEGTVNQFLGDGFMALFGAPIAHEDHAYRALLAASSIRQRLAAGELRKSEDIELTLRMGLHTGLVIVGAIGDNLRMDYTAVGDTTNVTARLQQLAAAGQIIMSEATHRLVAGYSTTRYVGDLALKGKAEPVRGWELLSVRETRTRLEAEAERGLTTFVGREHEMQTLLDCFAQAQAGHGQIVFLVGEAGLGKSRLLLECRRQIGTAATWLQGHALSFGQSMVFHPLIDMLRRNFGIEEDDAEAMVIDKINNGVVRLGDEVRTVRPYLRYVLGVDPGDPEIQSMDPQLRRAELFDALRRLLLHAGDVRPQVVVLEDLHWIDNATQAFLQFILDSIPASRVLCLLTYRPGYTHPFGERSYYTRIALPALTTSATVQMARSMLVTEQLPEELAVLIVQKAEGNPFFVEEVVKSLRETGVLQRQADRYVLTQSLDDVVIPDTIHGVLMARIDRLDEAAKQTLQLASLIGREFTHRLLTRLADNPSQLEASLQALKATELIYEVHRLPELTYTFKHALTQDVAYDSLLAQQRQDIHRQIGEAIETLYADRLTDQYNILAHHFVQGEVWDKGLDYLCQTAEKAVQAFEIHEALALYERALEAVRHLGDNIDKQTVMAIHQARANLYFIQSDFDRCRFENERVLALARQIGDRAGEGAALAGMGWGLMYAHNFDQALIYAHQSIHVAEAAEDRSSMASGYLIIGSIHGITGQFDQSQTELTQALAISQSAGDVRQQSLTLWFTGYLKRWEAAYDEAVALQTEGLRLARQHNLVVPLTNNLFGLGIALTGKGDYDGALDVLEEGLQLAEKMGYEVRFIRLLNSLGWLHSECGNLDRAVDLNRQSADVARRRGDPETIANAELNLGDIFLLQGDLALAQDFFDGVDRLANDPGTSAWMKWRYSTHLFASLGELWLARGDLAKAQTFAEQCLAIATRTNSRKYMIRAQRLEGEIAVARRQWDEADAYLTHACELAQTIGNPTQLWKTHLAIGRLHAESGQFDMSKRAYQAACEVIDQIKANLQHPELHASLERFRLIQQVYDLRAASS